MATVTDATLRDWQSRLSALSAEIAAAVPAPTPTPDPTPSPRVDPTIKVVKDSDGSTITGPVAVGTKLRAVVTGMVVSSFEWWNLTVKRSETSSVYTVITQDNNETVVAKAVGTRMDDGTAVTIASAAVSVGTVTPAPTPNPSPAPEPTPSPTPAPGSTSLALLPYPKSHWMWSTSGRQFSAASDPRNATLHTGGTYINSNNGYSIAVQQAKATDPLRTISSPQGTVSIRVPSGAHAMTGSDGNLVVIDPTGTYCDDFWIWDGASTARRWERSRLDGNGAPGIRAAGWSCLGGLIRDWEVRAGKIDHALTLLIPWNDAKRGYVAPATGEDSYSSQYAGTIPLGTWFALPPSVDIHAQGWSPGGVMLADAMQRRGCFASDTTYPGNGRTSTKVLVAEPSLAGTSQLNGMLADLTSIKSKLLAVV